MSLGVHFGLSEEDHRRLLGIEDPEALVEFISEDLEERYLADGAWSFESDKAWDAIHRCLTNGHLEYASGPYPLAYAVLGGRAIDAGDDYTACLLDANQVAETSAALVPITREWMRSKYDALPKDEYGSTSDDDFAYTWENFEGLRAFFARVAASERAMLFTTDA